jgi:hypothetical protein
MPVTGNDWDRRLNLGERKNHAEAGLSLRRGRLRFSLEPAAVLALPTAAVVAPATPDVRQAHRPTHPALHLAGARVNELHHFPIHGLLLSLIDDQAGFGASIRPGLTHRSTMPCLAAIDARRSGRSNAAYTKY